MADPYNASKQPFITMGQFNDVPQGPSSPFHAMEEGGDDMIVNTDSSDVNVPTQENNEGILMVQMTDSSEMGVQKGTVDDDDDDDDNNSTYSTLKVFQGTADFDYEINKGKGHNHKLFQFIMRCICSKFYLVSYDQQLRRVSGSSTKQNEVS